MDVGATPGGVADFPALSVNIPAIGPLFTAFVSFLDTPPSGPSALRAANGGVGGNGGFFPSTTMLNADPASSASEASGYAFAGAIVAWVENGHVFARSADFNLGIFSAPVLLNADPAHQARSPRVTSGNLVVFIEAGPAGDQIQARRWDGGAWIDPGVVNPGGSGPVNALAVSPGHLVGWSDAQNVVHVRQGNF
jgi:hypothetical protein